MERTNNSYMNEDKSSEVCPICKKTSETIDNFKEVMLNNHTNLTSIMEKIYEATRQLDRATQAIETISKDLHYPGHTAKGYRVNPALKEMMEEDAIASAESTELSCDNATTKGNP
ncbi:hypothetical protein PanWU01x14_235730 [Parasponia andersonii]|uniref:Uncharacterized protein n=1 Tax=Parasponia andersonii TaxID=3476 RepID=A0A2P5BIW4_PARAD|nr:hypothetical protein PanWU01x14_235730 [Parasponia andersonii]